MGPHELEPDRATMEAWAAAAVAVVADWVEALPDLPATALPVAGDPNRLAGDAGDTGDTDAVVRRLLRPPDEAPGDMGALLAEFREAAALVVETAGPSYMAYVGGGGVYSSALAEFVSRAFNRYTSLAAFAPALVAMEESAIRWLVGEMGLPPGRSGGVLTTGGSLATLTALVAARVHHLGDDIAAGTVYVTEYTHRCVAKAARIAGLRADQVRIVPVTDDLRMDPAAAAAMISADRHEGRRPFLLVGTAGTTHTGTVDPLAALADVAEREGVWFHVDGAYGGLFRLTDRGRARLAGIERADSVVLDPHKTLFLPHGTGVVLVRDAATLHRAYAADGHYLQDVTGDDALPDYADLGPELTREFRGLRLWLPLHLHGAAAFRAALDEKLDLARYAHDELSADPHLDVPWAPDLSTVVFRLRDRDDAANQALLARINATRRVHTSSTLVAGRYTLRLCVVSHRTHHARMAETLEIIRSAATQL